ncbi:MAG TPA: TetR/AcrR family transcriptional regulator [Candidatus Limnocylindrales bacterium]|nr:TetR/AcrR family transcriptional regulator [Candidatus Limnocylindrales bacterium]
MIPEPVNLSRERVLTAAESLFMEHGYAAVTLRDIANALGIRQASLYYHAPGGKEALFVTVVERALDRHQAGLEAAVAAAGPELRAQLSAAADWLLSQPAMNFARMVQSDIAAVEGEARLRLTERARRALLLPLQGVFMPVVQRRGEGFTEAAILSGAFLSMIEMVHVLPAEFGGPGKPVMVAYLIDALLNGVLPTKSTPS